MVTPEHERLDFTHVPQSQGIKAPAYVVLALGLFGIFFMGWLSYWSSGYGHMWQKDGASRNTMRMCLNQDEKTCPKGTAPQHSY